jgi:hypothetical protein
VVPTGIINGGSKTVPRYRNEDETFANQSRDNKLLNSEGDVQSLSKPKDAEQRGQQKDTTQLQNVLRNVLVKQIGNELFLTGLKGEPLPPQTNQGIDDKLQDIDLISTDYRADLSDKQS